jgi:YfiH family protein
MRKPDYPYQKFDDFLSIGFIAGVTIKGPWKDQGDIYRFIGQDLISNNMRLIIPNQVHGVDLVVIDNNKDCANFEADGVFTCRRDICLSITTADCLPVVLADPKTGYFAAIHIGWRSYIGGIVENIFKQADILNMDLGSMQAYIGPGIGDCCFKVGADVAMLFDEKFIRFRNGIYFVALRDAVESKIKALGLANVTSLQECTSCINDKYYSYRRDGDTPLQMVTYIFKTSSLGGR